MLKLIIFCFLLGLSSAIQWQPQKSMIFARSDFVVVSVGPIFYILGGCDTNQTLAGYCGSITDHFTYYNTTSDEWGVLGAAPRPRYRYMAANVGDDIYYIGGRNLTDGLIEEVDVYSIGTGSWTTLPNQNGATARSDGAAFVIGSKIYVTGGYDSSYNPLSDTIVLETTSGGKLFQNNLVAKKSIAAGDNGAVAIGGYGYVFGGWGGMDGAPANFCVPLSTVERYDPAANSWTSLENFLIPRGDMAYVSIAPFIFLIGGETKTPDCLTSLPQTFVEGYDVVSRTSTTISPIAFTRFRFSAGIYGNTIYDIGGQGTEDGDHYPVLRQVYSLDVSSFLLSPTPTPTPTPTPIPTPTPPSVATSKDISFSLLWIFIGILLTNLN